MMGQRAGQHTQQISGPVGSVTCKLWRRDGPGAPSRGEGRRCVCEHAPVLLLLLLLLLPRASG